MLRKFLRKFLRFLESTRRSSSGILMTFWENWKKILKKFKRYWAENFKLLQEIYGNIIGKKWIWNWRSHTQSNLTAKCWFWEKWEKAVLWKKIKIFKISLGEKKGLTFTHLIIFSFLKNTNALLLQCIKKIHLGHFAGMKNTFLIFLYAFISFTFQGWIRYRSFCSGRTPGALVKTITYSKFRIILFIPVCNLTLHLTFLPYLTICRTLPYRMSYLTLPYVLPYFTVSYLTIPYVLPHLTLPYILP